MARGDDWFDLYGFDEFRQHPIDVVGTLHVDEPAAAERLGR